jgi:chlorobactene glucosyltransferase
MIAAAISLLWAVAVAWLIARAHRQYRSYEVIRPEPLPGAAPAVDIVVPARNEADMIGRCLAGLAAQRYPPDRFRITLVDDGSTDPTATIARRIAAAAPWLRVVEAGPLPPGWTGKAHACWRGAATGAGEWLCFIDADTVPQPDLLRSAVATAHRHGFDLLSLEPRQELVTPWERLIIPAGLCALGFVGEVRRTSDPDGAAAANGQFLLIRRSAYERAGGHQAVRGVVAEDSALAARIKSCGGRIALMGGMPLISVRMYRSLPQLWEGIAKNVTETFGGVRATAVTAFFGVALAWAALGIPAALSAPSSPLAAAALVLAAAASLSLLGMHVAAARYFRIPLWYGLLFPLAYTLAALVAVAGIRAQRQGRVAWKGRSYRSTASGGSAASGD